jgi:hypothetical protein
MFVAAIRWLDMWLRFALWLRGHAVTLLRVAAVTFVIVITVIAGYTCHGLVGPPG